MEVGDARWDDFGDVTQTYYDLYEEVQERPDLGIALLSPRPTLGQEAVWFATLLKEVEDGNRVAAVPRVDGKAVGLCEVHQKGRSPEVAHLGELGILIGRRHRGQGIGRALLKYTLERCRGRFRSVVLSVFVVNEPARHLYRSLGFRPWGTLPRAVLRGGRFYDEEHMVVDLEPPASPGPIGGSPF